MASRSDTNVSRPATPADQSAFLALLPRVERHAAVRFRHLTPADREEATAAAVAHAFAAFLALQARGRDPATFPSALATFAVLAARNGRRVEGGSTTRDALDPTSRRRRGHAVHGLDDPRPGGGWWRDAVTDSKSAVPEQVAFKLDFPAWLARLPLTRRRAAELLGRGEATQDVARRLTLSCGRVSQLRRELAADWHRFNHTNSQPPI